VLTLFLAFGGTIMALVFTPDFRAGAPVLALLSVGFLVDVWSGSCGMVLSMTGHQVVLMRVKLLAAAATIAGSLLVVGRFGMLGVAVVATAVMIGQNLSMWILARRRTGMWTHPSIPTWAEVRALFGRDA
jgi:O-antigen/teichoic acid export membrane protein